MKTLNFNDKDAWMLARRGKITGSRLRDIITKKSGFGKKKGFYELIAERIAVEPDGENPMDRGNRLEDIAIARFTRETGKEVDTSLVIWTRDDNENIAVSPDGVVKKSKNTEACEVKCLNSASHIEAWITKEVPDEYRYQVIQYFVTNDKLKKLNVIFYDPRMAVKDYFVIEVKRKEIEDEIKFNLDYQIQTLKEVDEIVSSLTF